MADELTLGRKLYAFREDRKLSQSKLEVEADLSFGTISRIENGLTNPTKETLIKIGEILKLDDTEFNHLLIGRKATPTQEDIKNTIKQVKQLIDSSEFPAYLMDCQFRAWYWNDLILKMLEVDKSKTEKYRGSSTVKILLFSEFNLKEKIPKKKLPLIIKKQVDIYKQLVKKYKNEEFTRQEIRNLRKDDLFRAAWDNDTVSKETPLITDFYINFMGKTLEMEIVNNFLNFDNRFILVRYYPKNLQTAEVFEKLRRKIHNN